MASKVFVTSKTLLGPLSLTTYTARKFQIIIGAFFSIPICWVGGHWASTAMLSSVDFSEMLPAYMTSLVAIFMAIMSWPLVRLIIRVANDIGKSGTQ